MQASKQDEQQPSIASVLQPLAPGSSVDVVVAGCGPAGIHLAAVMAKKGINVGLVGECVCVRGGLGGGGCVVGGVDVAVAGCGPAGIYLAAVMGKKGILVPLWVSWGRRGGGGGVEDVVGLATQKRWCVRDLGRQATIWEGLWVIRE